MTTSAEAQPTDTNWPRALLTLVLFVGAGIGVGLLIGTAIKGAHLGLHLHPPEWPLLLVGGGVALFGTLAWHELGHLLAGWLVGFRFMLFIVGPVRISRDGDRICVGLNRDASLAGGLASALPTDERDLNRRMAIMVAGGPVASFVGAIIGGALFRWLNGGAFDGSSWQQAAFLFALFAVTSFAIGVGTLIPGKTSAFDTDGAQLLDALRGGHRAERKLRIISLVAASVAGRRPRDFDEAHLARMLELRQGNGQDAIPNLLAYYHRLDRGEFSEAGELIDLALAQAGALPAMARPHLWTEAAYFAARHRGNALEARTLLSRAGRAPVEAHTRLRAEAAVLAAEGRLEESRAKAREGLAAVGKSWDRGGAAAEREWLAGMLDGAAA